MISVSPLLPWLLFLTLSVLLLRIARSSEFAPEFALMVGVAWLRCALWLVDLMAAQNFLGYLFPVFQFLAAEESIRHSMVFTDDRLGSGKYWCCFGLGLVLGCIAWALMPGGLPTWRASAQVGIFAALCWSQAFAWRYQGIIMTSRLIAARQVLLAILLLGSLISTHPGGAKFSIWTQSIHLLSFAALCYAFPRKRSLNRASISANRLSFSA